MTSPIAPEFGQQCVEVSRRRVGAPGNRTPLCERLHGTDWLLMESSQGRRDRPTCANHKKHSPSGAVAQDKSGSEDDIWKDEGLRPSEDANLRRQPRETKFNNRLSFISRTVRQAVVARPSAAVAYRWRADVRRQNRRMPAIAVPSSVEPSSRRIKSKSLNIAWGRFASPDQGNRSAFRRIVVLETLDVVSAVWN